MVHFVLVRRFATRTDQLCRRIAAYAGPRRAAVPLLAASAQARRLMRPLCRVMGRPFPEVLRLPPRNKRTSRAGPPEPEVYGPPPPTPPEERPLSGYLRAPWSMRLRMPEPYVPGFRTFNVEAEWH